MNAKTSLSKPIMTRVLVLVSAQADFTLGLEELVKITKISDCLQQVVWSFLWQITS